MSFSQPISLAIQVASSDKPQAFVTLRKVLLAQSSIFPDILDSSAPLEELEALMDVCSNGLGQFDHFDLSLSSAPSEFNASLSVKGGAVISISNVIRGISIDRERLLHCDELELPIIIEHEIERTASVLDLLCYQEYHATLVGSREEILKAKELLEKDGIIPSKLELIMPIIDPQKIKLVYRSAILIIEGVEIYFRENSIQMGILRAMFGQHGKNRKKLDLVDLHEVSTNGQGWGWFDNAEANRSHKAQFIKQVRNAVAAINDKVRKATGWTEDFLEVKDNSCRINPILLI